MLAGVAAWRALNAWLPGLVLSLSYLCTEYVCTYSTSYVCMYVGC